MGQRASDTRGITFEDVEVPAEVSLASACLVCVLLGAGPAVDLLMKGHPYREHAVSFKDHFHEHQTKGPPNINSWSM